MVSGADTLLDIIAGENLEVTLEIDTLPFGGSEALTLTELCDPILGGGYYHMSSFEGKKIEMDLWLCEVTRFVFNDIPPQMFIKRVA